MLANGWWSWVGHPLGASTTNDLSLVKSEMDPFVETFEKRDVIMMDKAFISLKNELSSMVLTGWKRAANEDLERWKKQENYEISNQRG
jgi:hypothetical protein